MHRLFQLTFLVSAFLLLSGFTVIGHRGDPTVYPEETFQSFDSAFAQGANYVELDVHETSDGQIVVQHDNNLVRMTGVNRLISSSTLAQVQQAKTKNGEAVHSLADVFAHYQHTNAKILIETKIVKGEPHPDLEAKIAALINQYHYQNRVMFHSFSLSSLKRLQKVLPNVPRILIVGSLKRITFDSFKYVDGINISSDLITPDLVSQLHYIGKKVYIWDEMNENRVLWNWLVNLNIDGVVTNYPGLGHEFQSLKANAVSENVNSLASNTSNNALPIYMNPYQPAVRKRTLAPNAVVAVTKRVRLNQAVYYQIGQNAFVPAETINVAPQAGWAHLFLNHRIIIKTEALQLRLVDDPLQPSPTATQLTNGTIATVTAARYYNNQLWLRIESGWLPASEAQVLPPETDNQLWYYQYSQIPQQLKPVIHLPNNTAPLMSN